MPVLSYKGRTIYQAEHGEAECLAVLASASARDTTKRPCRFLVVVAIVCLYKHAVVYMCCDLPMGRQALTMVGKGLQSKTVLSVYVQAMTEGQHRYTQCGHA